MKTKMLSFIKSAMTPWDKWLYVLLVALSVAIKLNWLSLPQELLLMAVAVLAVTGDRSRIIALALCGIPMFNVMQYLYALALCIILYAIKYLRDFRWEFGLLPVAGLFFIEVFHSGGNLGQIWEAIRLIAPFVLLLLLMARKENNCDYVRVVRVFALITLAMSVLLLVQCAARAGDSVFRYIADAQRLGIVKHPIKNIVIINSNTWGGICLIAAIGLLQISLYGKGGKWDWVGTILLLIFGMLTQSRTFLLCLAIAMVLLMLALCPDRKTQKSGLLVLVGCGAAAFLVFFLCFPSVIISLVKRTLKVGLGNGRGDTFKAYMELLFSDVKLLFLGSGVQGMRDAAETIGVVPHNGLQELWVVWGLLGVALFAVLAVCYIKSSRRQNPHQKLINYIPLILIFIKVQLGQMVTIGHVMLIFAYAYVSLSYDFGSLPEKMRGDVLMARGKELVVRAVGTLRRKSCSKRRNENG